MAITIADADAYISAYVIDNTDWVEADDDKKQRILNVASRTLTNEYPDYVIPDDAVYEFAAKLAIVFNDTNRLQTHGIAGFSITGVGSFTFNATGDFSLSDFITQEVRDIIGNANGVQLGSRDIKVVIM